jgi:hypothetical protein
VEGFLDPPRYQQMDIPIGRLEDAAQAPGRDRARRPTGKLFQGFPPWVEGLHEDQPTEEEAMTAFPDAGHSAKQDRDKEGQVSDGNHSRPCSAKGESHRACGVPVPPFYHIPISTLIYKASWI